jgi:hypothetical protein
LRLDPRSLTVRQWVTIAHPPTALAGVPSGLWVSAGQSLLLLDASNGMIRRTVRLHAPIDNLVAAPSGELIYASTAPRTTPNDRTPVYELDATRGRTISHSDDAGYVDLWGLSGLAATGRGVWVTEPTGLLATIAFLRERDLRPVGHGREGSNAVVASYAGGFLWILDQPDVISCADPATGGPLGRVGNIDRAAHQRGRDEVGLVRGRVEVAPTTAPGADVLRPTRMGCPGGPPPRCA